MGEGVRSWVGARLGMGDGFKKIVIAVYCKKKIHINVFEVFELYLYSFIQLQRYTRIRGMDTIE